MGKGDLKTKKGKIRNKSYGKFRSTNNKKAKDQTLENLKKDQ